MWIVKWTVVGLICLVTFAMMIDGTPSINLYFFGLHVGRVPVFLLIYLSFGLGIALFCVGTEHHNLVDQLKRTRFQLRELEMKFIETKSALEESLKKQILTDDVEDEGKPQEEVAGDEDRPDGKTAATNDTQT